LAALVGAFLHHLVALVLVTFIAAPFTGVGTGGTDQVRKRPGLGGDAGGGPAKGRAILAGLERLEGLLLAVRDQLGAMGSAAVAGQGGLPARLRALHVGSVGGLRGCCLVVGVQWRSGEGCQGGESEQQYGE